MPQPGTAGSGAPAQQGYAGDPNYVPPKTKGKPPPGTPSRSSAGGGGPTSQSSPAGGASFPAGTYTKWTGKASDGAVPPGEYNILEALLGEWQALTGFQYYPTDKQLLAMANQGVQTLRDFGEYMSSQSAVANIAAMMPWATYGLSKDEYQSAASTFATEYKKITGQDISPEALQEAFKNPRDPTGGLLNQAQYAQQLMNDVNIQKQFGWVKYGLDYSAWTQQKLSIRGAFGRDINDSEAATILQYNKAALGANLSAVARASGQQSGAPASAGVAGSVAR